jgi:internalin A
MTGMIQLKELILENNLLCYYSSPISTSDTIIEKVKTITTSDSNLKTIGHLPSIQSLNLKYNKLESIPEFILKIPRCDLSHNAIQHGDINPSHSIKEHLLISLNLSHNKITSLPVESLGTRLISLNLSYNSLTYLTSNQIASLIYLKVYIIHIINYMMIYMIF